MPGFQKKINQQKTPPFSDVNCQRLVTAYKL
jgi:hypothetical protein